MALRILDDREPAFLGTTAMPGSDRVMCSIPGHVKAGMVGTLSVDPR